MVCTYLLFYLLTMFLIGLTILLTTSFLGSRLKGLSLSMLGGLGMLLLLLLLRTPPAEPPVQIILCIAAVVSAVGAIEAAGGLHYLVQVAEALIRKHPNRIIYLSPLVTYLLTFLAGTNHIAYSILPIIAEVSKEVGIRPERPLSLAVVAALHGALASPISSIMVILAGFLSGTGITIATICKLIIPSTLFGLCIATFVVGQLKQSLPDAAQCLTPDVDPLHVAEKSARPFPKATRKVKLSLGCFLLGSLWIVLTDAIKGLLPSWEIAGTKVFLPTSSILPLVMLATAALIMILCRIPTHRMITGKAFTAGIQGMFSLLGIAWLSSTFVEGNKQTLLHCIGEHLSAPWQFSLILLGMSAIMGSSAATIKAIFPLGIALAIPPKVLLASVAAVNGVFIIPVYPTMLAAIHLDTTGTTHIGKYLFNHSFMLPGLLSILGAVGMGFILIHTLIPG